MGAGSGGKSFPKNGTVRRFPWGVKEEGKYSILEERPEIGKPMIFLDQ
jgi:hypothetical protein